MSNSCTGNIGCGLVGVMMLAPLLVLVSLRSEYRQWYRLVRAQRWQPAQCEILFSQVERSSGKRDSSRINIQYRYRWNDRIYTGKDYDFSIGSDDMEGDEAKRQVVAANQPGQTVACFVDPTDPTQSVINRGFRRKYLLGAVLVAPFAIIPLFIIAWFVFSLREALKQRTLQVATASSSTESTFERVGTPVVLEPEISRVDRLDAVFWLYLQGIVVLFQAVGLLGLLMAGWVLYLALSPFLLLWLAVLLIGIHIALTPLNPMPTLTLSANSVPVGGSATLRWQMSGRTSRLKNLKIVLHAREVTRYRRDTKSYTVTNTFYKTQIVETNDPVCIERGMTTITIPQNTRHSCTADDKQIIWAVQVIGSIAFFPDVNETFDIIVSPQ